MPARTRLLAALLAAVALPGCGGTTSSGTGATTVTSPDVVHGHAIAPPGAPYRYTVPAGFTVAATEIEPKNQTSYRYLSMVSISRTSVISVKVIPNSAPAQPADVAAAVVGDAGRMRSSFASIGAAMGGVARASVAGRPAVRYTVTHLPNAAGGAHSSAVRTLVFTPHYVLFVSCQWTPASMRAPILAGCAALERSLALR
jgi:hypothetical protein